ncbi:flagellar basal body protein [Hydrogenibacillus sp. N12]|uniref:flagellar hook-basal body protein n=1 Tax=Hydrogenibacillus sp. N12 TaxID=2866627 RepID=UPI001C7CA746|nr:flagellar basal body protein [Hydrogenibacillus sp. N12]QZA32936.1 flagellar basal body protein [Hydrogenibacillus sp. N12]
MERSLIAVRHGLLAAQARLDAAAHNVANADTVGAKPRDVAFQTLFFDAYQNQPGGETAGQSRLTPEGVRLGGGAGAGGTFLRTDLAGVLVSSGEPTDLAIEGEGWFRLRPPEGDPPGGVVLARGGRFSLSPAPDGRLFLVDGRGAFVLDDNGAPVSIPRDAAGLVVRPDGAVFTRTADGAVVATGQRLALYRVHRPDALRALGDGAFFAPTGPGALPAGGLPAAEPVPAALRGTERARIVQGALERSAVDLGTELTGALLALRHTGLLARLAVQTDEMDGLSDELGGRNR